MFDEKGLYEIDKCRYSPNHVTHADDSYFSALPYANNRRSITKPLNGRHHQLLYNLVCILEIKQSSKT